MGGSCRLHRTFREDTRGKMLTKVIAGLISVCLLGAGYYWWVSSHEKHAATVAAASLLPQSAPLPAALPKQTTLAGIVTNPCRVRCRRLEGRARLRCTRACRERQRYVRCVQACGTGKESGTCKQNCSSQVSPKQKASSARGEGPE